MTHGTTYAVKARTGQQSESITLESQSIGYLVPLVAISVFVLTFAVPTAGVAQRVVFWIGFLGSIAVGIIVVHLTSNLNVPGDQLWLLTTEGVFFCANELACEMTDCRPTSARPTEAQLRELYSEHGELDGFSPAL
jgi:hypothetical protein